MHQCSCHRAAPLLRQVKSPTQFVLWEVTHLFAKTAVITHPDWHSLQQGLLWGQTWGTRFPFCAAAFIRIWGNNNNINLKKIKYCISPHPSAHDSRCLHAPCWAPRYGCTSQPHLSFMSSWSQVNADTFTPTTTCLLVCQQTLLLFQEFTACQQSFWG